MSGVFAATSTVPTRLDSDVFRLFFCCENDIILLLNDGRSTNASANARKRLLETMFVNSSVEFRGMSDDPKRSN